MLWFLFLYLGNNLYKKKKRHGCRALEGSSAPRNGDEMVFRHPTPPPVFSLPLSNLLSGACECYIDIERDVYIAHDPVRAIMEGWKRRPTKMNVSPAPGRTGRVKKTRDEKTTKKQETNTKLAASIIPFSLIYIYRQTCTLYLFSVLLLDPGGDMESPRDGNEQRGEDKLGVDGLWGEGVDKVALVDAEAAEHEGGDGGQGVEGGGHVLAQAEDVGRRVVARPLRVHAHGGRAARHAGRAARTCCGSGGHAGAAAHGAELCRAEGGRDGDA
jgi:hypothetical protein